MSVVRRSGASKQASMSRLAGEEYQKYASQGYDALSAPGGSYDRTDPDGRKATFTVTVNNDCNDGALPPNGFQAKPLDATQACCPNGRCCKALLVNMAWVDTSRPNKPTVNETYSGFVTKSCP